MADDPPTPPASVPTEIVDALSESSSEQLRAVATYAEALAEHEAREGRREDRAGRREGSGTRDEVETPPDDLPDGVPTRATITIKEINDNRYYYWQWRDGDKVESKYKGPVDAGE